jgi:hypothetical protein
MSAEDRATLLTADGKGAQAKAEALSRLTAAASGHDRLPLLCAEIARLCDVLRGERAYVAVCTVFPFGLSASGRMRVIEGQLRIKNCLHMLREKRAELVSQLNAITE